MLSFQDTPTINEWIALIQEDADQAERHVISLRARIKKQGLMADPSLTISVEDYDRAQQLLELAKNDSQKLQQVASKAAVGRVTLEQLPDRDDWLALINSDPGFARKVYVELEIKHALLGMGAPLALLRSIEAYHTITKQQA